MITNKKAQVTLFIIIGIVILVTVGIFIYFRTTAVKKEVEVGVREIETIPSELVPVRTFVETSITQTIEEGLRILGQHGGYIYTDKFSFNSLEPTEAEALDYFGVKIPYWYYMESSNECSGGCSFETKMPPLCKEDRGCITNGANSIEEELERYLNEKLKNLDFDLTGFEITKLADPESIITIRDSDVVVYVDYPLQIKTSVVAKMSQFQKVIESDLTEIYKTAYEITNYEMRNCFIEEHTSNYLSYYMTDLGKLPPTYDSTIATSEIKIWQVPLVKEDVKRKTYNAMKLVGIYNTSIEYPEGMLEQQYIFYAVKEFRDLAVTLAYNPSWNPYLDIKPNDDGILMPKNIDVSFGVASLFRHLTQTKIYEFDYMYSFPVVIDIKKEDSRGNVYSFKFALEANIRANECFKAEDTIINIIGTQSELCVPEERTNELRVEVKDELTKQPLSDVAIYFYAGETCRLGSTNKEGKLITNYPNAYGAFIRLRKEGYLEKYIHQSDFTSNIQTTLKPFKEKRVVLRLIDENTLKQMSAEKSQAISIMNSNLQLPKTDKLEYDNMLITLTREPDNYQDAPLEQTIYFNEGQTNPEKVNLLPGKYNISIQLYLTKDITIPKELDRICEPKPALK